MSAIVNHPKRRVGFRRGVAMSELMVALSLGAALLVAVAGAVGAAGDAATANDAFFRAGQVGRVGLNVMARDIRQAKAVVSCTPAYVEIVNRDGLPRGWRIDRPTAASPLGTLVMIAADGTEHPLVRHVSAASFTATYGTDTANQPCVASVDIDVAVTVGQTTLTLTAAASPRAYVAF